MEAIHSILPILPCLRPQVQWLLDSYGSGEGVSPARGAPCTATTCCTARSRSWSLSNAASFGKLIRSVFMGLRTRRPGHQVGPPAP